MLKIQRLLALLALGGGVVSCGAKGPIQKSPPTLADAGEAVCSADEPLTTPLVVEWTPAQRAQLEAALRQGAVAVRYVGCELSILPACTTPRAYAWQGVQKKTNVLRISDRDELYAKLPVGAASLQGKLAAGGALAVEMTTVGRYQLPGAVLRRDELQGDCAQATHVVTSASAGAFTLGSQASTDVSGGASVMGASAGAAHSSSFEKLSSDGDPSSCSADSSSAAPAGCGALIRIELANLAKSIPCVANMTWTAGTCERSEPCPRGSVPEGGACVEVGGARNVSQACLSGDVAGCEAECEKGIADSCADRAWSLMVAAEPGFETAAFPLVKRACELGSQLGCVYEAILLFRGKPMKDRARARMLADRGCGAGYAPACTFVGHLMTSEHGIFDSATPKDVLEEVAANYTNACELGHGPGCRWASTFTARALGDRARALPLAQRGCHLGSAHACLQHIVMEQTERRQALPSQRQLAQLQEACDSGGVHACSMVALFTRVGVPSLVVSDVQRANELDEAACNSGDRRSCMMLGRAYLIGEGVAANRLKAIDLLRKSCDVKGQIYANGPHCDVLSQLGSMPPEQGHQHLAATLTHPLPLLIGVPLGRR